MGIYFPVDPTIDANGDLTSVVRLNPDHVGRARPIDLQPGQSFFSSAGLETAILTSGTFSALQYTGGGRDPVDPDSMVCVIDVTCYSESRGGLPRQNVVVATRWGCGLRLFVTVTKMKRGFGLDGELEDLAAVAAAADLGLAAASYRITGIGLALEGFLAALGGIDSFGMLTGDLAVRMGKTILDKNNLYRLIADLRGQTAGGKPVLRSLPLEVQLRRDGDDARRLVPQSVAFGLRCLSDGLDVRSALYQGTIAGYDGRSIRRAYAMICSPEERPELLPPTATEMTIAQQWLDLKMV